MAVEMAEGGRESWGSNCTSGAGPGCAACPAAGGAAHAGRPESVVLARLGYPVHPVHVRKPPDIDGPFFQKNGPNQDPVVHGGQVSLLRRRWVQLV